MYQQGEIFIVQSADKLRYNATKKIVLLYAESRNKSKAPSIILCVHEARNLH